MTSQKTAHASRSATLLAVGEDTPVTVAEFGSVIEAARGGRVVLALRLDEARQRWKLAEAPSDAPAGERALAAIAEALFCWQPKLTCLDLDLDLDRHAPLARHALRSGLAQARRDGVSIHAGPLMQRRANWLADAATAPYPLDYTMSEGRRHPRRPPKPEGVVYVRHIPWLEQVISFRALTLDDLPLFHRWMNDPRVAAFWGEAGTIDAHRGYLGNLIADPHLLPLVGAFGDKPFGYFEVYWAKENRIAPFYDAGDYDRGWHVAVGEEAFRGRAYISAWLPSLMHYLFLDDPRTSRIVGEPALTHAQQIRNLEKSGFAKLKTFDFPHKRAALMMLLRERFFGDRLWLPAATNASEAQV